MAYMIKKLRKTRNIPLILDTGVAVILKCWIYASFTVHPNMRGYNGGGLYIGRGPPVVNSTKQNLNT